MPITISLLFPAGRYAAAAWDDRNEVEWPPHPARLCLGLIDALHRGGNQDAERQALEWLCTQGAPEVVVPSQRHACRDIQDGFFVPQNPSEATGPIHPRKARTFPVVHLDPDHPTIFFHWPEANPEEGTRAGLSTLLGRLPRFGHSSSLCLAELSLNAPLSDNNLWLVPNSPDAEPQASGLSLRVPYSGLLAEAEKAFDATARAAEMEKLIQAAAAKAKPGKNLKPAASPRGRHDPRHLWTQYQPRSQGLVTGPWDPRLLILKQESGARQGLVSTWQITEALHKAVLSKWGRHEAEFGPIPAWVSGHAPRSAAQEPSAPLQQGCHLALLPLPHVGSMHADGHLLGLALALPRQQNIPAVGSTDGSYRLQWQKVLQALFEEDGKLELGAADKSWVMQLAPYTSPGDGRAGAQTLRSTRWTGPASVWRTVTPIILDQHPKPSFHKDPDKWLVSCRDIIRKGCQRLGLDPLEVEPMMHSPMPGVGHAASFPAPVSRPGRPPRFHVHAEIRFAHDVVGPLMVGAGRYRGYGLLLPWTPDAGSRT